MAQTVRLTITPDLKNALQILHKSTMGTLNTTELIKMAIGAQAKRKEPLHEEMSPEELDRVSAGQFYAWAKEDGTLDVENIAHPEKLKPFVPKPYVRAR